MTRRGLFAAAIGLFVATRKTSEPSVPYGVPDSYVDIGGVRYTKIVLVRPATGMWVVGEADDGRESVSFPAHSIVREQRDWLTGGWNAQSFEADFRA